MNNKNCSSRSFKALMITQGLGAFNDNAFKIVVSLFAMRSLPDPETQAQFISFIAALFIFPFILVSPSAGYLADRYYKRDIIVIMKVVEFVVMSLGFLALLSANLFFICFIVFLMTTQSAFFGPSKYGILPEMLDERDISKGNGYLQMWTFLAIILGTAFGGQLISSFHDHIERVSYFLIGISAVGIIASINIAKGNVALSTKKFEANFFKDCLKYFQEIRRKKPLFRTLLAVGYFWFMGAVVQMNALLYGRHILQLSEMSTSLLLVAASIGIGLGSYLAGKFSEGRIEFGIVPVGSIGISIFCLVLSSPLIWFTGVMFRLFMLGLSAGFYIVPLNAYFQQRSPHIKRGKYLAVLNVTNALAILLGAAFMWLSSAVWHLSARQVFLVVGVISVGVTVYVFKFLPDAFLRFFNWVLTHSLYRIRIVGAESIPKKGGALLVCNHTSFVDPSLILASTTRHVRFLVLRPVYEHFFYGFFCKIMNAIPISLDDPPKEIAKSLQTARDAVKKGHVVCIFAEGGLTRTGNMLPFNRGFEYIMKDLKAPIIPMYIDCIWGSIFSFEEGKFFWKLPRRTLYPVTVSYGEPMSSNSTAYQVRMAVQERGARTFQLRGPHQKKLHIAFISEAKKHPFRFCMADSTGLELNYIKVLGTIMLLSKKLFPLPTPIGQPIGQLGDGSIRHPGDEFVGVLLPASCMGSMVNGAILMSGKIPVNLNFTASKESLASAIQQCEIKTIITSRKFLSKVDIEEQDNMVFLEDLKKVISDQEKKISVIKALLLPSFLIKALYVRGDKRNVNDIATIIFSSGSTGEPKGVMLTHANIFSNIEGFWQVGKIKRNDVIMGVLPFFHSFGFTACMCLPVGVGIGVVYHPNPLDAATIGKLVEKYKATMIIGTPTFFASYIRKCTKEQFSSVRLAIAGAEKFKEKMVHAFIEKFGIIPFEGYGATELSPVVSMGAPDWVSEKEQIRQTGHKLGKVGHPIPGVAAKIVNPDTFETLDYDQEGLLLIKGANVMKGYLNNPEKTQEVIKDGWYITGDIASIDEGGFIRITDRLSRFSKIGGEMVPHVKIEEEILNVLDTVDPVCAVTSLSDERKGEKLVVLYKGDINIEEVSEQLNVKGLPNLWIPKKENYYQVEDIPLLGSGKMNLKKIKEMAKQLEAEKQEAQGNATDNAKE